MSLETTETESTESLSATDLKIISDLTVHHASLRGLDKMMNEAKELHKKKDLEWEKERNKANEKIKAREYLASSLLRLMLKMLSPLKERYKNVISKELWSHFVAISDELAAIMLSYESNYPEDIRVFKK